MRRIVLTLWVTILILFVWTCAQADLRTLMELGRSQAAIARALRKETKNYNRVKQAITSGKLEEGIKADRIRKKYGDPIIDTYDKKRNAYRWLYMPATSTHFEGEKLYLFIDEEDKLVGWKLIE